jgi:hypothetical protein
LSHRFGERVVAEDGSKRAILDENQIWRRFKKRFQQL